MSSEPSSTQFKLLLQAVQDNKVSQKELVIQLYGLLREGGFSISEMIEHFRRKNPEYSFNEDYEPELTYEQLRANTEFQCQTCGSHDLQYSQAQLRKMSVDDYKKMYASLCDNCLKSSDCCIGCNNKSVPLVAKVCGGNPRVSMCDRCWT